MVRTHVTAWVGVVALFTASAMAQSAEAPPALGRGPGMTQPQGPQGPQVPQRPQRAISPYWNQDEVSSDLPAADIRTVPGAKAAAVQAKWQYHQSMVDLSNAVRLMQLQMESAPEFVDAMTAENNAYDALQRARKDALASLQDNAAYAASESLRRSVSVQIEDETFRDKPGQARIDALARLKLEYVRDNRKLEIAVLDGDQVYVTARQKYLDTGARVRELRRQQSMTVLTDNNLTGLRRSVAENRVNRLASAAYLEAAIRARNIAVDYATFYQSYDRRPYYTAGYYYSNYGAYGYRY